MFFDERISALLFILVFSSGFVLSPIITGNAEFKINIIKQDDRVALLEGQVTNLKQTVQNQEQQIELLELNVPNYSWIGWTAFFCIAIICITYYHTRPKPATTKPTKKKGELS